MNFAQLRDAARERCGLNTTDQMATPDNMGRLVNSALHSIDAKRGSGWPWNLIAFDTTLTFGQEAYQFSDLAPAGTEILKIRNVYLTVATTQQPLEGMGIEALLNVYRSTVPGMPYAWATDGYALVFGPSPNDTWPVAIQALIADPELTDDAQTPRMPSIFHDVIIEWAAYIEYRRTGKPNDANLALQSAMSIVADMRQFARTRTGPGRVFLRDPNE